MVLGGVAGSHLPNCRAHHGSGSRSLLDTDDSGSKLGYLVWREGYNVYQPTYVSLSVIQMEDTLSATYFRLVPPPPTTVQGALSPNQLKEDSGKCNILNFLFIFG